MFHCLAVLYMTQSCLFTDLLFFRFSLFLQIRDDRTGSDTMIRGPYAADLGKFTGQHKPETFMRAVDVASAVSLELQKQNRHQQQGASLVTKMGSNQSQYYLTSDSRAESSLGMSASTTSSQTTNGRKRLFFGGNGCIIPEFDLQKV